MKTGDAFQQILAAHQDTEVSCAGVSAEGVTGPQAAADSFEVTKIPLLSNLDSCQQTALTYKDTAVIQRSLSFEAPCSQRRVTRTVQLPLQASMITRVAQLLQIALPG
jgi:hypothetical protein